MKIIYKLNYSCPSFSPPKTCPFSLFLLLDTISILYPMATAGNSRTMTDCYLFLKRLLEDHSSISYLSTILIIFEESHIEVLMLSKSVLT